jgi:hypothetical protein
MFLAIRHRAWQASSTQDAKSARPSFAWQYRLRSLLQGTLAGFLVVVVSVLLHFFPGRNFYAVIPGHAYRCAQPTARDLERFVNEYGIQTVINLRGYCPKAFWYREETRALARLEVVQVDMGFKSSMPPSPARLRKLVRILDRVRPPILFHCHSGADRSGLAAAIVLLMHSNMEPAQARRQLNLRYGHWLWGRAGWMDRFFDCYVRWLKEERMGHSAGRFRRWAREEYRPEDCL